MMIQENAQLRSICESMLQELRTNDLGRDQYHHKYDTPTTSDYAPFSKPRYATPAKYSSRAAAELVAKTTPPNTVLTSSGVSLSTDLEARLREHDANLKSTKTFVAGVSAYDHADPPVEPDASLSRPQHHHHRHRRQHAGAEARYDTDYAPLTSRSTDFGQDSDRKWTAAEDGLSQELTNRATRMRKNSDDLVVMRNGDIVRRPKAPPSDAKSEYADHRIGDRGLSYRDTKENIEPVKDYDAAAVREPTSTGKQYASTDSRTNVDIVNNDYGTGNRVRESQPCNRVAPKYSELDTLAKDLKSSPYAASSAYRTNRSSPGSPPFSLTRSSDYASPAKAPPHIAAATTTYQTSSYRTTAASQPTTPRINASQDHDDVIVSTTQKRLDDDLLKAERCLAESKIWPTSASSLDNISLR